MNRVRGTLGALQHGAFSQDGLSHEVTKERAHLVSTVLVLAVVRAHLVDDDPGPVDTYAALLLEAQDGAQGAFRAGHREEGGLGHGEDALAGGPAHRGKRPQEGRAVNQNHVVGARRGVHHALESANERCGFLTVHEGGTCRPAGDPYATGVDGGVGQQGRFAHQPVPGGLSGFIGEGSFVGAGNQGGHVGDAFVDG